MKDGARKMMSGGRAMEEEDYKRMGDTKDQMGGSRDPMDDAGDNK